VLLGTADEPVGDVESLLDILEHAGNSVRLRVMRSGKISLMDVSLGDSGPGRAA